jgi:centrosomal protein CEP290
MASFKIASLQKALEDSIPLSELDRTNKKLHEITEKYRDHLEKGNSLVSKAEALTGLEVSHIYIYLSLVVTENINHSLS